MKTILSIGIALYKAKGIYKLFLILSTATLTTPLVDALEKFLLPNFDNLAIFLILLILDIVSGLFKHSGKWSKEAKNTLDKDEFFFKLFRKMFASVVWLMFINVIENLSETTSVYFNNFGIGVLVSWLGWSITANLYVITGGTFPPEWVLKKLKQGNKDSDLNDKNIEENEE